MATVKAIIGRKPDGATTIQSLLFPRSEWNLTKARRWAKSHGFRYDNVHTTDSYYRFRQGEPKFSLYRTITLKRNPPISIIHCELADREHGRSRRQYAHTYHYGNEVICVSRHLHQLPDEHRLAILLHEIGHILAGPEGSEEDADAAAEADSGIPIYYIDSPYGAQLEYIDPEDVELAVEYVRSMTDYD